MTLFKLNFENKTLTIFITSLIWAINFRTTFKNIDNHMDLGSYSTLKFNPKLILFKNLSCSLSLLIFFIEIKLGHSKKKKENKIFTEKQKEYIVVLETKDTVKKEGYFELLFRYHRIEDKKSKFNFIMKNLIYIIIIYFIEESYFLISNNHIMERIICPIRNLAIFIGLLIFYPIIFKKCYALYRHQIIPLIIIIFLNIILIVNNSFVVQRFYKILNLTNIIIYSSIYFLMSLEISLTKYLTDKQQINIFLIIGLKGIIGSITFSIINYFYSEYDFFNLFDNILAFEFEDTYEKFILVQQIIYIASLVIVQCLKIYLINQFTETHFLYSLMITDIIYFPFYCLERFFIQNFKINTPRSFFPNLAAVIISFFLVLIIVEILECNCCNCNLNTRKNINKRQLNDMLSTFGQLSEE